MREVGVVRVGTMYIEQHHSFQLEYLHYKIGSILLGGFDGPTQFQRRQPYFT